MCTESALARYLQQPLWWWEKVVYIVGGEAALCARICAREGSSMVVWCICILTYYKYKNVWLRPHRTLHRHIRHCSYDDEGVRKKKGRKPATRVKEGVGLLAVQCVCVCVYKSVRHWACMASPAGDHPHATFASVHLSLSLDSLSALAEALLTI